MFPGHAVACARHPVGCWAWLTANLWNSRGFSALLTWVHLWTTLGGCRSGPSPPTMSDGWMACVKLAAITAAVLQPSRPVASVLSSAPVCKVQSEALVLVN